MNQKVFISITIIFSLFLFGCQPDDIEEMEEEEQEQISSSPTCPHGTNWVNSGNDDYIFMFRGSELDSVSNVFLITGGMGFPMFSMNFEFDSIPDGGVYFVTSSSTISSEENEVRVTGALDNVSFWAKSDQHVWVEKDEEYIQVTFCDFVLEKHIGVFEYEDMPCENGNIKVSY